MPVVGLDGKTLEAQESNECLNLFRSTVWQGPGVEEIWSPWGWDRLYYLLCGCLAQGIVWWRDGRAVSRIRHAPPPPFF